MNKAYSIVIKIVLMIIMVIGIIVFILFTFNNMKIVSLTDSNIKNSDNTKNKQININSNIEKQIIDGRTVKEINDIRSLDDFDSVFFGKYLQNHNNDSLEPIEWIILHKDENTAVLMSKYILDSKPLSNDNELSNWETSDIRGWLNSEFYEMAFNDDEKDRIISTVCSNKTYSNKTFEIMQNDNSTTDKVYLVDIEEIKKYFSVEDFYTSNIKLTTYGTDRSKYFLTIRGDLDWANGNSYWIIRDSMRGSSSSSSSNGKITYNLKSRQVMYITATGSLTWGTYNRSKLGIRPVINIRYK